MIRSKVEFFVFRLVHDREIQLYDGARLIAHDAYDQMLKDGRSSSELANTGIFRIHPSFRIVALAEPPTGTFQTKSQKNLNEALPIVFQLKAVRIG